jgi:hypothetical protein
LAEINFMIGEMERRARLSDNGGAESSDADSGERSGRRSAAIQSAGYAG